VSRFLQREREVLDALLPGLDKRLADEPLMQLEQPGGSGLTAFKECNGPALLVPADYAGIGASLLDAVRVQRAVGARSPSVAVGTTMHHFSVASLVAAAEQAPGFEWMLLEGVARERLLMASGFAEGRTGQGILSPAIRATQRGDTVVLDGAKKPCSLSGSMDLLTASFTLPDDDGTPQLAVALIPVRTPGLTVRPFWGSSVLAGAESDEVVLEDVEVPPQLIVRTATAAGQPLDHLQTVGFLWFELLMAASYLGAASALVERVLAGTADAATRAGLVVEAEAAMLAIEGAARAVADGAADDIALAAALACRYSVQDSIGRITRIATEALGGMAFVSSPEVAYLGSACSALAFHPPSRSRMAEPLCAYYAGDPLRTA
jgi:alkylation response protein AidB-like acyl-CoA dehydrogenase